MVTTRPQTLHFLSLFLFITYILQNKGHIILKLITYPTPRMANLKILNLLLLFFVFICAAQITQGSRTNIIKAYPQSAHHISAAGEKDLQVHGIRDNARRLMIGSVAPTCTYNECRGCKYRCRAEQVPVEGNDPMNSAYHYKCICHR